MSSDKKTHRIVAQAFLPELHLDENLDVFNPVFSRLPGKRNLLAESCVSILVRNTGLSHMLFRRSMGNQIADRCVARTLHSLE